MKNQNKLLSRTEFREQVLSRSDHQCVMCGNTKASDAHHIIERRLFPDGGYYLNNGAAVCADCHWLCESTDISVEQVREAAGVEVLNPPNFYYDDHIDKWGNYISPRDYWLRYPGPLADDPSVLKVLGMARNNITLSQHRKYPRTPHLPGSPSLVGQEYTWDFDFSSGLIITEKMDGENITMYNDKVHARSLDSRHREDQDLAKAFWAKRCGEIPLGMRVCAEYLYAKHSIHYDSLPDYVLGISVWDGQKCLSWPDTLEWFELLDITPVPVLKEIKNDTSIEAVVSSAKETWETACGGASKSEGFVIRSSAAFDLRDFSANVGKWVRDNHVDSSRHWRHESFTVNGLRK